MTEQDCCLDEMLAQTYVSPKRAESLRAFLSADGKYYFLIANGRLYREDDSGSRRLVCATLPTVEWYDLVHFVQSPSNPVELWLCVSGLELYRSGDGGLSFELCKDVRLVGDLSFVPARWWDQDYVVCLLGSVRGQGQGFFSTRDGGRTWESIDLTETIPIL